jgi:ParB family chromosome partitioning protein
MSEAIVTVGIEKDEVRKVCVNPEYPIPNPKKQPNRATATAKAEQEKEHREEALANSICLRSQFYRCRRPRSSNEARLVLHH